MVGFDDFKQGLRGAITTYGLTAAMTFGGAAGALSNTTAPADLNNVDAKHILINQGDPIKGLQKGSLEYLYAEAMILHEAGKEDLLEYIFNEIREKEKAESITEAEREGAKKKASESVDWDNLKYADIEDVVEDVKERSETKVISAADIAAVNEAQQDAAPVAPEKTYNDQAYGEAEEPASTMTYQAEPHKDDVVVKEGKTYDLSKYKKQTTFYIPAGVSAKFENAFFDAHTFKTGTQRLGFVEGGRDGDFAYVVRDDQGRSKGVISFNNAKMSKAFSDISRQKRRDSNISDELENLGEQAGKVITRQQTIDAAADKVVPSFLGQVLSWAGKNKREFENEFERADPAKAESARLAFRTQNGDIPEILPDKEAKKPIIGNSQGSIDVEKILNKGDDTYRGLVDGSYEAQYTAVNVAQIQQKEPEKGKWQKLHEAKEAKKAESQKSSDYFRGMS